MKATCALPPSWLTDQRRQLAIEAAHELASIGHWISTGAMPDALASAIGLRMVTLTNCQLDALEDDEQQPEVIYEHLVGKEVAQANPLVDRRYAV